MFTNSHGVAGTALAAMIFCSCPIQGVNAASDEAMTTASIDNPIDDPRGRRLAGASGVGGGLLVGALVAGPIGAALGAGLGSWLGSRVVTAGRAEEAGARLTQTQQTLGVTQEHLAASEARASRLEMELDDQQDQLVELAEASSRARQANAELREALASGLELQVMFRTDESELTEASAAQVAALADVLAGVRGLAVRLDAYTDPRGEAGYNEALAVQRAAAVRSALLAAGLDERNVETFAHGETASSAVAGDFDAYALERRVDISVLSVHGVDPGRFTERGIQEEADEADLAAIVN